jgi:flagellar hook-length control protein FliK
MNANILPIDVLPIPKGQSAGRSYSKSPAGIKDWERIGGSDQQFVSDTRSDNIRTGRHQRPASEGIDSSDNNYINIQSASKKSSKSDFRCVLKRRVETEQPVNEQAETEDVTETQESETKSDSQQVQTDTAVQAIISVLDEQGAQEQSAAGLTSEAISSSTQNQPDSQSVLLEISENQQQVSPQGTSQKVDSPDTAILATADEIIASQIPQEGQSSSTRDSSANAVNEPAQQNDVTVTQDSADKIVKTEFSQSTVSTDTQTQSQNTTGAAVDTKVMNAVEQAGELENEQSPVLSSETIVQQGNPDQPVEPKVTKDRRQGDGKINTDQIKENTSQDKSAGKLNSQNDRLNNELDSNGLAERLGIEKVELINGKDGSPNSNPVNFAPLISRGAVTDESIVQNTANHSAFDDSLKADTAESAARDVSTSIREQIAQSVQTAAQQGARQITIQLNPPELGRVSIKFSEKGAELSGQLEATNPQTRAEIRQAIPDILRSLEQSGISVKRIDVSLSDLTGRSNQQSPRDNFPQQLWEHSANNGFDEQGHNHSAYDSYSKSPYTADIFETKIQSSFGYSQQQSAAIAPSSSGLDVLI